MVTEGSLFCPTVCGERFCLGIYRRLPTSYHIKAMNQEKPGEGSNPSPSAIVAFLRGINVGGRNTVPMAVLKKAFETMGFRDVRTVLASGNVIFEATGKDPRLDLTISPGLEKAFGFPVTVVLRRARELRAIVASEPFKGVPSGPDVKLYVTFLATKKPGLSGLQPHSSAKGVRIVRVVPGEIFSVVTLSPGVGTPELMAFLEKAVGHEVTTRNWQTVIRLASP
jgi:uncharacterized protein (DUF1697 family)